MVTAQVEAVSSDAELERFRREWEQEVKQRRQGPQQGVSSSPTRKQAITVEVEEEPSSPEKHKIAWKEGDGSIREVLAGLRLEEVELEEDNSPVASTSKAASPPVRTKPLSPTKYTHLLPTATKLRSIAATKAADAVVLYSRAVEAEQTGRLNEALALYRRAFRLDDGVDRAYQRHMARLESQSSTQLTEPEKEKAVKEPKSPEAEKNFTFRQHIQMHPDYDGRHRPAVPTDASSPLGRIFIAKHERIANPEVIEGQEPVDHIAFRPADEDKPMPIANMPDELLGQVFQYLDVKSLERFATACWRSREVVGFGADAVWRDICRAIYRYPQIPRNVPSLTLTALSKRHGSDHRSVFVEEPRVRMDGCYISVCHYIRPGASEAWVAITHMITYHRFLRFYPNGTVISFLTTDHPSDVIPTLRPSLRAKGLHFGDWQLVRPEIDESGSSKGEISVVVKNLVEPGVKNVRYEFEMKLGLKSTQRGRWNKLDLQAYQSINMETEETLLLSLKHQKPFYFSKVRSYQPAL